MRERSLQPQEKKKREKKNSLTAFHYIPKFT